MTRGLSIDPPCSTSNNYIVVLMNLIEWYLKLKYRLSSSVCKLCRSWRISRLSRLRLSICRYEFESVTRHLHTIGPNLTLQQYACSSAALKFKQNHSFLKYVIFSKLRVIFIYIYSISIFIAKYIYLIYILW